LMVVRLPRCALRYAATDASMETSGWSAPPRTSPASYPAGQHAAKVCIEHALAHVQRDAGPHANNVRLNSCTAAGTSAPTASGAYPVAHAA
jgi:hypothetical protein